MIIRLMFAAPGKKRLGSQCNVRRVAMEWPATGGYIEYIGILSENLKAFRKSLLLFVWNVNQLLCRRPDAMAMRSQKSFGRLQKTGRPRDDAMGASVDCHGIQ